MRCSQPSGTKGSLRWIQTLVGKHPAVLTSAIRSRGGLSGSWSVDWLSPREADDWAEYRDADFLSLLGLSCLNDDLAAYWPSRGPQWDALGLSSEGEVVLVEAKSHLNELRSDCGAAEPSLQKIRESIAATKAHLQVAASADWLNGYYQYANRLAHLHFLQQHDASARLVFVYFVNDVDMAGPASVSDWEGGLATVYSALGLTEQPAGVLNVFIDVSVEPPQPSA